MKVENIEKDWEMPIFTNKSFTFGCNGNRTGSIGRAVASHNRGA